MVFSPVSASLIESVIPRKLTALSEGVVVVGTLVPLEKTQRFSFSFEMSLMIKLLVYTIYSKSLMFISQNRHLSNSASTYLQG